MPTPWFRCCCWLRISPISSATPAGPCRQTTISWCRRLTGLSSASKKWKKMPISTRSAGKSSFSCPSSMPMSTGHRCRGPLISSSIRAAASVPAPRAHVLRDGDALVPCARRGRGRVKETLGAQRHRRPPHEKRVSRDLLPSRA